MKESISLIRLDFLTMKPYYKQILCGYGIVGIAIIPNFPVLISIMCFILGAMFLNYPFMLSEKNDMDKLYKILPVRKNDIINAKYLSLVFYGLLIGLFLIPVNFIVHRYLIPDIAINYLFVILLVGLCIYLIVGSIQIPCYLKYGFAKARMVAMVLPVLIGTVIPLVVVTTRKLCGKAAVTDYSKIIQVYLREKLGVFTMWLVLLTAISIIISYLWSKKI